MKLLLRFYDATEGLIIVNDSNIKDYDINYLRRKIGFVGQEPVLFAMTIE